MKHFCARLSALALLFFAAFAVFSTPAAAADGSGRLIALTFDDGPSKYTNSLLDGLAARGVKATFFMQGCNAEVYPGVVKRAYEEGHQIASHTYNHPNLTSLSVSSIQYQINHTDSILDQAIGQDLNYVLRPPYGSYNRTVLNTVGTPCFYWSVDPMDWKYRDANIVYNNIVSKAGNGSIVLAHDLYPSTVTAVLNAVDTLQSQGYEFVTVNELFRRRGTTPVSGYVYFSAAGDTTLPAVSAPTITIMDGVDGKWISLSETNGAPVYYTTDGSNPVPSSTLYTEPIYLTSDTTIRAVSAYQFNGGRSDVTAETISIVCTAIPELSLIDDQISISAEANAAIYYTTDGSEPTVNSLRYTEPLPVIPGTTYRAIAQAPGALVSRTAQLTCSSRGHLFRDISVLDWFYDSIDQAVDEKLFQGVSDTAFAPRDGITRGMMVTVLYRMAGEPKLKEDKMRFQDVETDRYYTTPVAWAFSEGIATGYDEHTFAPDQYITRQELCKMVHRYIKSCGKQIPDSQSELPFTDTDQIADWAIEDVSALTSADVICGRTETIFDPTASATRAEAGTIVLRLENQLDTLPDAEKSDSDRDKKPNRKSKKDSKSSKTDTKLGQVSKKDSKSKS